MNKKKPTDHTLLREWVCAVCGGRLVRKGEWVETTVQGAARSVGERTGELIEWIECGVCGGEDFIHEAKWERQKAEAREVRANLPPEILEMLEGEDV